MTPSSSLPDEWPVGIMRPPSCLALVAPSTLLAVVKRQHYPYPGAQGLHFKTRTQHHSIQFQLIKILLVETVYSLGKPKDKYFQSSGGAYPNLRFSNDNEDNLYTFTLWLVRYFVKWKFLKNAVIWWNKFWNQLSRLWKNVNRIWF